MADFLFNINDGFADALLRGYRSTFLRDDEFHHLKQCKSVEGELVWGRHGAFIQY